MREQIQHMIQQGKIILSLQINTDIIKWLEFTSWKGVKVGEMERNGG